MAQCICHRQPTPAGGGKTASEDERQGYVFISDVVTERPDIKIHNIATQDFKYDKM